MRVLGIDPGMSGAIAMFDGAFDPQFIRLDETEADISSILCSWISQQPCHAFIEKVHSMPKQGVASSFKFGKCYGFLRGLLIALRVPFEEVTPQRWQKEMECLTKGDKNVSKARAQQLFPNVKVIHATADALLIAEYGRRTLATRNGYLTASQ